MDPEKASLANVRSPVHDQHYRTRSTIARVLKIALCTLLVATVLWRIYVSWEPLILWNDIRGDSQLQNGDISTQSTVTQITYEWGPPNAEYWYFCNVIGSANDAAYYENGTNEKAWLDAWEEIAQPENYPIACAVEGCANNATIGGHVVEPGGVVSPAHGSSGAAFLVPLCDHHNSIDTPGLGFPPKAVTAVELDKYCQGSAAHCAEPPDPTVKCTEPPQGAD